MSLAKVIVNKIAADLIVESINAFRETLSELKKQKERIKVLRILVIIHKMSVQLDEPLPIDQVVRNLESEGYERKHILEAIRIGMEGGYLQILMKKTPKALVQV